MKTKFLLFLSAFLTITFVACNDDDKDENDNFPIENLQLPPSTTPLKTGEPIAIQGKGFTTGSEIWLKPTSGNSVQATVTSVTETGITFTAPETISGLCDVILKQNGQEYSLGELTFETNTIKQVKYYTFCYDDNIRELAEIDIETGRLTWTGGKIPEFGGNSRGYVFDENKNEFVAFDFDIITNIPTIYRLNLSTKEVIKKTLTNLNGGGNFREIVQYKNKYYTFCYDSDISELAEIDIETGRLTWTGGKIPEFGSNFRGNVFDENRNEFIGFDIAYDPTIYRLNLSTKEVVKKVLTNLNEGGDFRDIIAR